MVKKLRKTRRPVKLPVWLRNRWFAFFELTNQNANLGITSLDLVLWLVNSNYAYQRFQTLVRVAYLASCPFPNAENVVISLSVTHLLSCSSRSDVSLFFQVKNVRRILPMSGLLAQVGFGLVWENVAEMILRRLSQNVSRGMAPSVLQTCDWSFTWWTGSVVGCSYRLPLYRIWSFQARFSRY